MLDEVNTEMKRLFNCSIEHNAKKLKNFYAIYVDDVMPNDATLFELLTGSLTLKGYEVYWNCLDSVIKRVNLAEIKQHKPNKKCDDPQPEQRTQRIKQSGKAKRFGGEISKGTHRIEMKSVEAMSVINSLNLSNSTSTSVSTTVSKLPGLSRTAAGVTCHFCHTGILPHPAQWELCGILRNIY